MPRVRQPTAVLRDRGTFDHDPKRGKARADEIEPAGPLGAPPKAMAKEEKALWYEMKGRAAPGCLQTGDEYALEMAVHLMHEFRTKRAAFKQHVQLLKALAEIGLTPAGRSYIKKPAGMAKEPPKNRFGALRRRAELVQ